MDIGILEPRKHTGKRTARAKFWETIYDIFNVDTNTQVPHLFQCILCKGLIYNASKDCNTMPFNRHKCIVAGNANKAKRLLISQDEKLKLAVASALFVTKDFRPFYAVECDGLLNLCTAAMQFGQRYPKATVDDLKEAMPTRNTVASHVSQISSGVKRDIRKVMDAAKEQNGLAATTDCWTDKFRHYAYMCITIHVTLIEEHRMKSYRYVISMDVITELVKTKQVIIGTILKSFAAYDYSAEDVKKFVTFVSDRGPNIRYGLKDRGFDHNHCWSHLLNNLSGKMLMVPAVAEMIRDSNRLCSYMKNTGKEKYTNIEIIQTRNKIVVGFK